MRRNFMPTLSLISVLLFMSSCSFLASHPEQLGIIEKEAFELSEILIETEFQKEFRK